MIYKYILPCLLAGVLTIFIACDNEEEETFEQEIVVQSAMYVNQPMIIKLARTIPWNEYYDAEEIVIEDADVSITVSGNTYVLTEANSGIAGCYRADDDAPVVLPGAHYELFIAYEGDTIRAETTCAGPIEIIDTNIDPNDPMMPDTFEYGERDSNDVVINPWIEWTTDPINRGYAMMLENLEPDWYEDYREVGEDNGPCDLPVSAFTFVDLNSQPIPNIVLCSTGLHRARILSCDQALFDYFQTTFLGDPENYPVSNLTAGQGVFWAGDADTVYFYLTDDFED